MENHEGPHDKAQVIHSHTWPLERHALGGHTQLQDWNELLGIQSPQITEIWTREVFMSLICLKDHQKGDPGLVWRALQGVNLSVLLLHYTKLPFLRITHGPGWLLELQPSYPRFNHQERKKDKGTTEEWLCASHLLGKVPRSFHMILHDSHDICISLGKLPYMAMPSCKGGCDI